MISALAQIFHYTHFPGLHTLKILLFLNSAWQSGLRSFLKTIKVSWITTENSPVLRNAHPFVVIEYLFVNIFLWILASPESIADGAPNSKMGGGGEGIAVNLLLYKLQRKSISIKKKKPWKKLKWVSQGCELCFRVVDHGLHISLPDTS